MSGRQQHYEPIVYDDADLARVEIPVTIGATKYLLIEASEDDARRYRNAATNRGRITFKENEDREITPGDLGDLESYLVSLCLHELDASGTPIRTAPLLDIRRWKHKVVKHLFNTIRDISDLVEAPETVEDLQKTIDKLTSKRDGLLAGKNGQPAGKGTSS